MKMYLQHYFRPNFNHLQLRPDVDDKGQTDLYNLGYVQNVVKGQILAEIVPLSSIKNPESHFILKDKIFPQGPNTYINPEYPQYLLAAVNGYVFYYEDKISVKKLLNVRSNVDFRTGNIVFVGDVMVHEDVRAGFQVQANNILINGMVEGGEIRARKDIKVVGGARGGNNRCLLSAGSSLKINFAENAELRSRKKLYIDRFCLQCKVYSLEECIVSGMVLGGSIQSLKHVLVKDVVGNNSGVSTKIFLGYDPFLLRDLERCEARLEKLNERITHYTNIVGHLPPETNEKTKELFQENKRRERLISYRNALWDLLQLDEAQAKACRFVVLGTVYPGVEVTIGPAFYIVKEELHNILFKLQNEEIVIEPAPENIKVFFTSHEN